MIPDGRRIGCVSGGCLEGEIVKKAWWFTDSGAPVIRLYDTRSEDDAVWEFGLGCNGVVHVMLERINTPAVAAMLDYLDAHRRERKPSVIATVVRADADLTIRVGDRLLLDESWTPIGNLCGSTIESRTLLHAAAALREKKSRLAHIGMADVFVEWIDPPLSLVIFGAGHDAIPLVNFARQLGWDIAVADGRPAYARPERFPGADCVVTLTPGSTLSEFDIDQDTAVVMMTHNYPLDALLLPQILGLRPRYLGLLGPRARADRLFAELGLNQPPFVHAPAGLDAGCDSPEAIALSIVTEIQAETNSRPGGKLKYRREPIHAAAYEVGVPSEDSLAAEAIRPSFCETIAGNRA
jgi:xanthine/CO dehydrogenase XdhC/CoxF family maturation factor